MYVVERCMCGADDCPHCHPRHVRDEDPWFDDGAAYNAILDEEETDA